MKFYNVTGRLHRVCSGTVMVMNLPLTVSTSIESYVVLNETISSLYHITEHILCIVTRIILLYTPVYVYSAKKGLGLLVCMAF